MQEQLHHFESEKLLCTPETGTTGSIGDVGQCADNANGRITKVLLKCVIYNVYKSSIMAALVRERQLHLMIIAVTISNHISVSTR